MKDIKAMKLFYLSPPSHCTGVRDRFSRSKLVFVFRAPDVFFVVVAEGFAIIGMLSNSESDL